jgi:glutathione S-transferase
MARTLYTTPFCAYCDRVKDELDRRALDYEEVTVPVVRAQRQDVFRLSGQRQVPVLVDEGTVVHDSVRILEFLKRKYS